LVDVVGVLGAPTTVATAVATHCFIVAICFFVGGLNAGPKGLTALQAVASDMIIVNRKSGGYQPANMPEDCA
jgi:hypothetical protein